MWSRDQSRLTHFSSVFPIKLHHFRNLTLSPSVPESRNETVSQPDVESLSHCPPYSGTPGKNGLMQTRRVRLRAVPRRFFDRNAIERRLYKLDLEPFRRFAGPTQRWQRSAAVGRSPNAAGGRASFRSSGAHFAGALLARFFENPWPEERGSICISEIRFDVRWACS